MSSITEEMRYRQRLCEYALKNGVTKAQEGIIRTASSYTDN